MLVIPSACSNVYIISFFTKVVSSVSSRLHLNRLSRPDLSSTDVRPNWRRRVASATSSCSPPVDWATLGERFRRALSRIKGRVPALKMPPVRGRRGWCGCFQVNTRQRDLCANPVKKQKKTNAGTHKKPIINSSIGKEEGKNC